MRGERKDLSDIVVNLVNIDTEIIGKVYDDILAPVCKELGKVGGDTAKAARLVLTRPIQHLAAEQNKLERQLQYVAQQVPEERRIDVPPSFSVPIIQSLALHGAEDNLAKLYLNLLARAMDKERVNEAHPAFISIINQLAPDEAAFLFFLKKLGNTMQLTEKADLGEDNMLCNQEYTSDMFPIDKLCFPENFGLYASHLLSLNLIEWPVTDRCKVPESNKHIRRSMIVATEFGLKFIEACIPHEGFDLEHFTSTDQEAVQHSPIN